MSSLSRGEQPQLDSSDRLFQLAPGQMAELFPFHLILDQDLRILQTGRSFSRILPDVPTGALLPEMFQLERPRGDFSFSSILNNTKELFLLSRIGRDLRLRGQMMVLADGQHLAFLCSPWLPQPGSMKAAGVGLNDFPLHDSMPELVQVIQTHQLTMDDLRKLNARLQQQREALKAANQQILLQSTEFRKLALIAARTDNGVVVTDADGLVEWVNDGFTRMTGYTLEDMRGKSPGTVLQGPETDAKEAAAIGGSLRNGQAVRAELINYHKDGKKYWVAIEIQPIHDEAGRLTNFMAIESDITARKQEEHRRNLSHTVTSLLADATDTEETLDSILRTICQSVGADFAALWRTDAGTETLTCRRTWCRTPVAYQAFRDATVAAVKTPGTGLPGMVWTENRPQWIGDLSAEPASARATAAVQAGLTSAFAFPIRINGEVHGVMEFYGAHLEDPGRELVQILSELGNQVGLFLDRRESEAENSRILSILDSTLESSVDGILVVSLDRTSLIYNRSFLQMAGFQDRGAARPSYEELRDNAFKEIADSEEFAALLEQCGRQPEHSGRIVVPMKDGRVIAFETHPQRADGETIGRIWTTRDITEQWKANQALRESEERYRRVMQSATDAILTVDERGRIVFASRSAERLFGYPAAELKGMLVWRLVPPELRSKEALHQARKNSGKRSWESVEVAALRSDGIRVPAEISLHRSRVDGRTFMTGVLRDISERKIAETQLRDAAQTAEMANRAKSDFLAHVSHEIRTPLNAIIGMTELLRETELDSEQREMLRTVWASSESLLHLINDILDLSKIEVGQVDLDSSEFDPVQICERAIEILGPHAQRKRLEVVCSMDPPSPPPLVGDPIRIHQILLNLLTNAVKFTESGSVALRLKWSAIDSTTAWCEFSVEDTGIGIPPPLRGKIFDKFYRVDSVTGRRAGGAGLGLSISRLLAEAMGGTLDYEPAEREGSIFRLKLRLPAAFDQRKKHREEPTLLLASPQRLRMLTGTLRSAGVSVAHAGTVDQACREIVREQPLQFVVVDGRLPMDANAARKLLRQASLRPEVQLVVLQRADDPVADPWASADVVKRVEYPLTPTRVRGVLFGRAGSMGPLEEKVNPQPALSAMRASILLVEDNLDSQIYARRVFEKAGHRVTVATTGKEALDAAEAARFDVIFMDVMLPDMTGFEVTTRIRQYAKANGLRRTPIIALTAHALSEYRQKAFETDMDSYLTKPVRADALVRAVERWTDQRRLVLALVDDGDSEALLRTFLANSSEFQLVVARDRQEAESLAVRRRVALLLLQITSSPEETIECLAAMKRTLPGLPVLGVSAGWEAKWCQEWARLGGGELLPSPLRREPLVQAIHSASNLESEFADAEKHPPATGGPTVFVASDVADLVPDYLERLRNDLVQLEALTRSGSLERLREIGHNLKGSGGAYGFEEVSRLGREIESAARAKDLSQANAAILSLTSYLSTVHWVIKD